MQSAPKPAAAARMRSSSVAMTTEAAPLAPARSHTHWIIGRPAIMSKRLARQARRGESGRYDDVEHAAVRENQRISSGSSAPSTRASSGSITGIPSRTA